jgi:hypothetical protein
MGAGRLSVENEGWRAARSNCKAVRSREKPTNQKGERLKAFQPSRRANLTSRREIV